MKSKFLTIGGIIVDDENKSRFNNEYNRIISTFFNFTRPENFKLHYRRVSNSHVWKKDSGI